MSPNWSRSEREQLCDLLIEVGPDAPTLCEGWTTRDLAAHIVIREGRPDASLGIVIKQLDSWTQRIQNDATARPWPELVAAIRTGPPFWSPFRLPGVDRFANLAEFFIHHEDVRRARPEWEPRELPDQLSDQLWRIERAQSSAQFMRSGVAVMLHRTDGRGGQHLARPGDSRVTITGPAAELMLFSFGRRGVARVKISGNESAVAKLTQADLSV